MKVTSLYERHAGAAPPLRQAAESGACSALTGDGSMLLFLYVFKKNSGL
jgi:hypothetical protein